MSILNDVEGPKLKWSQSLLTCYKERLDTVLSKLQSSCLTEQPLVRCTIPLAFGKLALDIIDALVTAQVALSSVNLYSSDIRTLQRIGLVERDWVLSKKPEIAGFVNDFETLEVSLLAAFADPYYRYCRLALEYPEDGDSEVNIIALRLLKKYAREGELYSMKLRDHILSSVKLNHRTSIRVLRVTAQDVFQKKG